MAQSNTPSAPNFAQQYAQGLNVYLKNLPGELQQELGYRGTYDPQFIQHQQALQNVYGPTQIAQQQQALQQMDPQLVAARQALGAQITKQQQQGYVDPRQAALYGQITGTAQGQLAQGSQLDPQSLRQVQQTIAARQSGLGNQGNAADMAAAVYTGQRGQQLLAQRQAAATSAYQQQAPQTQVNAQTGTFLSQPTTAQYANQIAGIQVPSAMQYVNPQAGYQGAQYGLQNYQNQLAQSSTQSNPWMGALSGAAGGAATGSMFGPYGTAIGAVGGAALGAFSDARLKENVSRTGETTRDGIPVVTFNWFGNKKRFRGVIAQDVMKKRPDAVFRRPSGYLLVDYDKLGIKPEDA